MKRVALFLVICLAGGILSAAPSQPVEMKKVIAAVQKELGPNTPVIPVPDINAYMRQLASKPDIEDSFHIVNLQALVDQYTLWTRQMPGITPYYAVKTNHDQGIVAALAAMGTGFDCATKGEIEQVLNLGVEPDRIIFAHTRKPVSSIKFAVEKGVRKMTFDSMEELEKMAKYAPDGQYLLRIKTDDTHSLAALSAKFGATMPAAYAMLDYAFGKKKKLPIVGIAFHAGSNSEDSTTYTKAISDAAALFNHAAKKWSVKLSILDLGGGWTGDNDKRFVEFSTIVNNHIKKLFPADTVVIAEPGRYFATNAYTVVMRVTGKDVGKNGKEKEISYYLSNGAYGFFVSSITYGYENKKLESEGWHFKPVFPEKASKETYPTVLWGPTCDSYDKIGTLWQLPEINTNDFLYTATAGAYTYSTQTDFNQVTKSKPYYVYETGKQIGYFLICQITGQEK